MSSTAALPTDIIFEILTRISQPESLLRFRTVCKQWRSLIDDPVFAQSHHYDTLLIQDECSRQLYTIPLGYLNYISETTEIHPTKVNAIGRTDIRLQFELPQASCHGLILTAARRLGRYADQYGLVNPYTNEDHLILPSIGLSPAKRNDMVGYTTDYIGLGYDAATDDYKVLRIAVRLAPEPDYHEVHKTLIYSVKQRAWHVINDFLKYRTTSSYMIFYPDGAAFVNGALHWIIREHRERGQHVNVVGWIVALDLTTETYRKLPLPPDNIRSFLRINALGGYLFLSYHRHNQTTIWILKDYGKENRWTRLLHYNSSSSKMRPIAYIKSKDQVIIRTRRNQFMWFGVKNKEPLKKLTLCNGLKYFPYKFLILPVSLNWLHGIGGSGDGKLEAEAEKTNDRLRLKLKLKIHRYEQSP